MIVFDKRIVILRLGRVLPWLAVGAAEEAGGLRVVDHQLLFWIVSQGTAPQLHRQVRQNAAGCGDVAFLDVGNRSAAIGQRRRATWRKSRTAAPLGLVTKAMQHGNAGSGRLRAGSNNPSTARR